MYRPDALRALLPALRSLGGSLSDAALLGQRGDALGTGVDVRPAGVKGVAGLAGLQPATSRLEGDRSIHLSYRSLVTELSDTCPEGHLRTHMELGYFAGWGLTPKSPTLCQRPSHIQSGGSLACTRQDLNLRHDG